MIKNTLKQKKFEDKTVNSSQLSLVLVGHHDFQIFNFRTIYGACVKCGSGNDMFGLSLLRPSWQTNISTSDEDPFPWRTRSVKCPTLGQQRQSNPHPMPCPPRRLYIDRCISLSTSGYCPTTHFGSAANASG